MRFLITSISGKKGYKSFKNLNEYVEFMTEKGHLVKELKEADLPYTDKPVKLPKVSKSNGWSEVTDFGEVGEEAEKGESLIASTSKSVMKDEASFEMSKSSGKADKPEMGLGAEKGDVDMSDFKSFEYEEPKLKSSETKESAPKSEEPKSEESKEDKKDSDESSKKEEKKDESKKYDKDIEECLKAAGIQLNEERKRNIIYKEPEPRSNEDKAYDELYFNYDVKHLDDDELKKICMVLSKKYNIDGDKFYKMIYKNTHWLHDELKNSKPNNIKSENLDEGIKDYLPRAGFIRDDDEDKDSAKMGIWGGQGTDEQLRKAKIIAKVKFANGDRMGRVTSEDLKHFDEYKAQYDEIYGSDKLDEGWKDKFKKGAATLGVAASLAGNAMAHDPMYDGATRPFEDTDMTVQQVEMQEKAKKLPNGMIKDEFGNEWTQEEWNKLINGEDPYADGARNPQIEESDDDMLNVDIAECLKAAGVQLNEFFHFDGPDPDDESKESDDEKTYKKYMKKEISDDEARSELKKQGYKGKEAKNLVKNAKSKRDSK